MRSWLEPALASVLAQGLAERPWFDPSLEVRDSLALAHRIAMHRVLKPLNELLQVRDPSFKRPNPIGLRLYAARLCSLASRRSGAADLPDPRSQPVALRHRSPPTSRLGLRGAWRVAASLFVGHLTYHQRAAVHLLAHQVQLLGPLFLDPLTRALHRII
jgi:hypothetical protein